jgi:hypothetical protein
MPYREDDAQDELEAPTSEGLLRVVLAPGRIDLAVGRTQLHLAEDAVELVEEVGRNKRQRRTRFAVDGIAIARGMPREDLGVWVTVEGSVQRVFGVQPLDLLAEDGLPALARLDALARRVRVALSELGEQAELAWSARAVEIGAGHPLDKVLLADQGDRHVLYARRLFRERARPVLAVYPGGRVVVLGGRKDREIQVTSRFGVIVRGDYVRFTDRHGTDLAEVAIPWVAPEDRVEVGRRIGQLVDATGG